MKNPKASFAWGAREVNRNQRFSDQRNVTAVGRPSSVVRRPQESNGCFFGRDIPQLHVILYGSFFVTDGGEVDAELVGFLVKVAAFQAEGLGGVGDVGLVALEFGENGFAFEGLNAVGECTGEIRLGKRGCR
jgi:hypothetical protein